MNKRSFLKLLSCVPAAASSVSAFASSTSKSIPAPTDIELGVYLRQVYSSFLWAPLDQVTRNSMTNQLSNGCMAYGFPEFKVKIDDENNPPDVVANRDLVADVYVLRGKLATRFRLSTQGMTMTRMIDVRSLA